jgi:hypothetical protein
MSGKSRNRFWRILRVYFRRFRIFIWIIVLAILGSILYLNRIGLPDFAKKPILAKLRQQGIELQFARLRLTWDRGIVADQVRFGATDQKRIAHLRARTAEIQFNHRAMLHFHLQVDSLVLRQGHLEMPLLPVDGQPRNLEVDGIQTELRLLPGDQWRLDQFAANFQGAKLSMTGSITNASAVPLLLRGKSGPRKRPEQFQREITHIADILESVKFSAPPDLKLDIRGDARDSQSFNARLVINSPAAETPWGKLNQGRLVARVFPGLSNALSHAEISVDTLQADTRWGSAGKFQFVMRVTPGVEPGGQAQVELDAAATTITTPWADAAQGSFHADWLASFTNLVPVFAQGDLRLVQGHSRWVNADLFELRGAMETIATNPVAPDDSWGPFKKIVPYQIEWRANGTHCWATNLIVDDFKAAGKWRPPFLSVTNIAAEMLSGRLLASGAMNVTNGSIQTRVSSTFDPHRAEGLLTTGGRAWLQQFAWQKPPLAQATIAVKLPAWTNSHPDWRGEVQPSLILDGEFDAPYGGSFRGVPVSSAHSHFSYSNMVWSLPDLTLLRPEGGAQASHLSNDRTKDYYFKIHSDVDLTIIRPLLTEAQRRGLDLLKFSQPPRLDAELWGRWRQYDQIRGHGTVSAANFTFRGEQFDTIGGAFQYTNLTFKISNPFATSGTQYMSAASAIVDISAKKIFLTEGTVTGDPAFVARAIGSNVFRVMEPYQFSLPVRARVSGVIPMQKAEDADLHFDLDAPGLHWWKFKLNHVSGSINWVGQHLTLADVKTDFYGGKAIGSAAFDFHPRQGTDFRFGLITTNTILEYLMTDLTGHRSKLEGYLSGNLAVTSANTRDWQTVQGNGRLDLSDGLIWEIPLFGIFSEVLNGISPGLGSSRATAGGGTFVITNGVVHSDDLEIRSAAIRLLYHGSVDLNSHLNARVEAEFLRGVPALGPLLSTFLWPLTKMFEYQVTGTLQQPKKEPVFILPKILMAPFHPIRAFKGNAPEIESNTSITNAAPAPNVAPTPTQNPR